MQPAVPPEPTPDPDPGPRGPPPPEGGWRWEATGALLCVPLFGGWLWLTDGHVSGCGQVMLAVLLGMGIGLAVSGCRRGSAESRRAALVALGFHFLITALVVGYAVRGWWFDRW
jgi:hypothetical protein